MAKSKKRTKSTRQARRTISPLLIGIVTIAAILLVVGLIILGNQSGRGSDPVDIGQFPAKGNVNAPVTIVEYSDYG